MQTRPAAVFMGTRTQTPMLTLSPILRPETIRALVLSKTHAPNKTEPAPALLITITALISSKTLEDSKIGQAKVSHGTITAPATSNPLASTKMVLDSLTITKARNMPTMLNNIRTFSIHSAISPNG